MKSFITSRPEVIDFHVHVYDPVYVYYVNLFSFFFFLASKLVVVMRRVIPVLLDMYGKDISRFHM